MFMNRKENIIKVSIPPNYCIKLIQIVVLAIKNRWKKQHVKNRPWASINQFYDRNGISKPVGRR